MLRDDEDDQLKDSDFYMKSFKALRRKFCGFERSKQRIEYFLNLTKQFSATRDQGHKKMVEMNFSKIKTLPSSPAIFKRPKNHKLMLTVLSIIPKFAVNCSIH